MVASTKTKRLMICDAFISNEIIKMKFVVFSLSSPFVFCSIKIKFDFIWPFHDRNFATVAELIGRIRSADVQNGYKNQPHTYNSEAACSCFPS